MAKSRGRKFAEITSPSSGVFDLTSVPTITNAKLQNSAMTLAGSSVSLGGTGVANTDALSEGSSNLYFTNARVQSFLGGGTLAGNIVVPDNRSIYLGSNSDFSMVHNTTNTQLINATGALQVTSNGGFDVTGPATFSSTIAATGNITGTLATAVQPNITQVGSLTLPTLLTLTASANNQCTVLFTEAGSNKFNVSHVGSSDKFQIYNYNTSSAALEIASNGNITVAGSLTAQNIIDIATDSTIQTTSARQWATIKNTGTGTGDYSEMRISNDNNDYLIMGSVGSNYSTADWSSSSYIYANRELRIKSLQGIRFFVGGFAIGSDDDMILEQAGNLGIGITSGISSRLHVNSEISVGPDGNNRGIINYGSNILSFGTRQSSTNYFNTCLLYTSDAADE